MAFTKHTFIATKKPLEQQFKENIQTEVMGMKLSLGGDALNNGAEGLAAVAEEYAAVQCGLRDTMLLAFNCAYDNRPDPHPSIPALYSLSYALLRLALIITHHHIA